MASSIFRVSRTETEGQQSGPATLNKAQEPVKMRVYEDESDVDLSEIGDKEIFAVEEENDLANVYVTDLVQEGNMNPITSNAVARFTGANYSTDEVKTSNTWIDGKPIYRLVSVANRTLDGSDVVVTSVFSQAIADTVDTLIKFTAVGGRTAYPSQPSSAPMTATFNAWQSTSDNRNIYCNADNRIYSTSVIVEYTKTTD